MSTASVHGESVPIRINRASACRHGNLEPPGVRSAGGTSDREAHRPNAAGGNSDLCRVLAGDRAIRRQTEQANAVLSGAEVDERQRGIRAHRLRGAVVDLDRIAIRVLARSAGGNTDLEGAARRRRCAAGDGERNRDRLARSYRDVPRVVTDHLTVGGEPAESDAVDTAQELVQRRARARSNGPAIVAVEQNGEAVRISAGTGGGGSYVYAAGRRAAGHRKVDRGG